jgi:hypothetical protein
MVLVTQTVTKINIHHFSRVTGRISRTNLVIAVRRELRDHVRSNTTRSIEEPEGIYLGDYSATQVLSYSSPSSLEIDESEDACRQNAILRINKIDDMLRLVNLTKSFDQNLSSNVLMDAELVRSGGVICQISGKKT